MDDKYVFTECSNSVLQTPSTLYSQTSKNSRNVEFDHVTEAKRLEYENESLEKNNKENDNDKELIIKNPFCFFRKKDTLFLIIGTIFNCLAASTTVATTIMINRLFDKLSSFQKGEYSHVHNFMYDLKWTCFSLVLIGLGSTCFGWAETTIFSILGEKQQIRCRRKLYRSLLSRKYQWFESKKQLEGELIQLNRSVEEFREGISEYLSILFKSVFTIIALMITSFIYSWRLTLLIMATFPLIFFTILIFGGIIDKNAKQEDEFTSQTISLLDWNFLSFIWVKIIYSKDLENDKIKQKLDQCEKSFRKFITFANIVGGVMKSLCLMMFVQSFWFGSWLIKKNYNSSGQVIASFYACLSIAMTVGNISVLTIVIQKANTSFKKILCYMDKKEMDKSDDNSEFNSKGYIPVQDLQGDIILDRVSFGYYSRTNSDLVLDNVSIHIPQNQTTAIVGKSGSGKSTISSLLLNLYQPLSGSITIDGYNIESLNKIWLRQQITLVQQFSTIFNGTIKENLLLGTQIDSSQTDLISPIINMFNLAELIKKLPNGLETFIGKGTESSVQLSGGQEQRLLLARAKLRDSNILVLDETVSAIDISQRDIIFQRIREWRKGKTTIIITHEFSQINDFDNVYLIENGKVIEHGLKRELLQCNGIFKELEHFENSGSVAKKKKRKSYFEFEIYDFCNEKEIQDNTILNNIADLESQVEGIDVKQNIKTPIFITYNLLIKLLPFKFKIIFILGLIFSVSNSVLTPVFSYFISKLIIGIVPSENGHLVSTYYQMKWALVVTGIAIADGITYFISSNLLAYAAESFCKALRYGSFLKIQNQSMHWFETCKANEMSTLIMNDMRDLRTVILSTIAHLISGLAIMIVGIAWSLSISWKLALVGFSLFPLFGIFSLISTILMQKLEFKYKNSLNDLEDIIHETTVGFKTIICLNLQSHFMNKFEKNLVQVLSNGILRAFGMGFSINSVAFITSLTQAIMFYYGLTLVANSEYTLVEVMQVLMMIIFSTTFITQLLSGAPTLYRGLRVSIKLNKVLNLETDKNQSCGYLTPNFDIVEAENTFQLKNVSFAYSNMSSNLILDNINLKIPSNKITCLVGESGCGKSTIMFLLLRLYPVGEYNGKLEICGHDINTIKLSWIRRNIAVVSQKHFFFDGTFRENLLYNNPVKHNISDDDIFAVLESLELKDFVMNLPNGLDSNLGISRNLLVSGGQAQRLSIARALLRPANILLLDECTASLDPYSADIIMKLLISLKTGKTIICVTHKQEMMRKSDYICFIKNGRVVEDGSYDELIKNENYLWDMVRNNN